MRAVALEALTVAYLFFPTLGGAVANGLCIRFDWASGLARPVDRGRMWRGRRLFGDNKTYRGFVAFSVGAAAFAYLQHAWLHQLEAVQRIELYHLSAGWALVFGFALGLAALLSELPNSMVKRQLGVAPGSSADGIWSPVFFIVDQLDLLLGTWLVLATVISVSWRWVAISVAAMLLLHPLVSVIGYALGMRRTVV